MTEKDDKLREEIASGQEYERIMEVAEAGGEDDNAGQAIVTVLKTEFPEIYQNKEAFEEWRDRVDEDLKDGKDNTIHLYRERGEEIRSEFFDTPVENETEQEKNSRHIRDMQIQREKLHGPHMNLED